MFEGIGASRFRLGLGRTIWAAETTAAALAALSVLLLPLLAGDVVTAEVITGIGVVTPAAVFGQMRARELILGSSVDGQTRSALTRRLPALATLVVGIPLAVLAGRLGWALDWLVVLLVGGKAFEAQGIAIQAGVLRENRLPRYLSLVVGRGGTHLGAAIIGGLAKSATVYGLAYLFVSGAIWVFEVRSRGRLAGPARLPANLRTTVFLSGVEGSVVGAQSSVGRVVAGNVLSSADATLYGLGTLSLRMVTPIAAAISRVAILDQRSSQTSLMSAAKRWLSLTIVSLVGGQFLAVLVQRISGAQVTNLFVFGAILAALFSALSLTTITADIVAAQGQSAKMILPATAAAALVGFSPLFVALSVKNLLLIQVALYCLRGIGNVAILASGNLRARGQR